MPCSPLRLTFLGFVVLGLLAGAPALAAQETVQPSADGTLAEGGSHGEFQTPPIPDAADWTFDQSGWENAITLTLETPESFLEQRMVWEYDLSGVSLAPPVTATLTFTLRGVEV